jgi:hypothetical protein
VTGLYVNSNHVLVFDDPSVAAKYDEVFEESWNDQVSGTKFRQSALSKNVFSFSSKTVPQTEITFSPHDAAFAGTILDGLVKRIAKEGNKSKVVGASCLP